MVCGDARTRAAAVGVFAIIFVIVLLLLNAFYTGEIERDWAYYLQAVLWFLIVPTAVALLIGIYYENSFIVMVWLIVVSVIGVILAIFYIIALAHLIEDIDIIVASIFFIIHIVFFACCVWFPYKFYSTISDSDPY
ncbi:uncharacterized protein LOC113565155 isoform X2 [Drosophila persimilis]|uniref:uncharacterized protein LOC113565155 isoform X2 n=1 Tax=Drosophila persimilis TaxID=7234 RepID=UPI000F079795|nr:uncharacterized protein LOC113565155 isoform X2 [Drosophila persimilis]